jgi:hypothetical protein
LLVREAASVVGGGAAKVRELCGGTVETPRRQASSERWGRMVRGADPTNEGRSGSGAAAWRAREAN